MGFVQLAPRRHKQNKSLLAPPPCKIQKKTTYTVACEHCGLMVKRGFALAAHMLLHDAKSLSHEANSLSQRLMAGGHDAPCLSGNEALFSSELELAASFLPEAPPVMHENLDKVSAYLNALNNGCGPTDLYHLTEYCAWGPRPPNARVTEQTRFFGACDAGVGLSDAHAQVILDYCRSRDGAELPKTVDTCWANIQRAHINMCGTMKKVGYLFCYAM